MGNRWLLIETFGGDGHEEPTVIAVGRNPKRMRPLASVLGRSLDDIRGLIARVVNSGEPVRYATQDSHHQLIGIPLISFAGWVQGVWAWIGEPDEEPPERDPAGAWYFNLSTHKIGGSHDLLDLYGVAPQDRQTERNTAEAFGRLMPHADEPSALAIIVRAQPGEEHQATWIVIRDDGQLRAVNLAFRTVTVTRDDGQVEVVARGITHDIGPADTPSAPSRMGLAQRVLTAEKEPGRYRAVMSLRDLTLVRWIDDPMPGIAWENNGPYQAALHPDDLSAALRMSVHVAGTGRAEGRLRIRSATGTWIPVAVDARLMFLDQRTTAALVTVSAQR